MSKFKKIIIADDHIIFREGLKQVIATSVNLQVTDEVGTGQELLRKVEKNEFDLAILDISMPGRNGLDTLSDLKRIRPRLPVLILSMHPEEQYALRAYKSGASGYMTKDTPPAEMLDALQKLAAGKKYVSANLAEALVTGLGEPMPIEIQHRLSNREYQVLCMIASGKPVGKIATEMALSVKTISTYRSHILRKLGMQNNSELTRFAIENNLV
jgi:DNA-binding NarL/FixJ family response regulator